MRTQQQGPALQVRGLRKAYQDVVAVDGLDLEIHAGECFGLLGPNGAGKTTTIEICEGLNTPDSGEVLVLGPPLGKGRPRPYASCSASPCRKPNSPKSSQSKRPCGSSAASIAVVPPRQT